MTAYILTEEDFDGGLTVFDPSTGFTKISGRNIHTGQPCVAYLNVPLCVGCDAPFDANGWCPRCEETADDQAALTECRSDPFPNELQKRDAA